MAELGNDGQQKRRKRSIVLPSILILLGILLLLNNLGVVDWDVWGAIARIWPLILIAVGLELILGRGSISGAIGFMIILVIIAGSGLAFHSPVNCCSPDGLLHQNRAWALSFTKSSESVYESALMTHMTI